MLLNNVWYFFLKIFKRNPDLKKSDFSNPSFVHKMWLVLFSIKQVNEVQSFRRKYFPTVNFFHAKNDFISYNFNLSTFYKINKILKDFDFFKLKKFFHNEKKIFVILLFLIFLKKNFFKFFSFRFYKTYSNINLIKPFFLFLYKSKKIKKQLKLFNLNKYEDWFVYNFNSNRIVFFKKGFDSNAVKLDSFKKKIDFYKYTYLSFAQKFNLPYHYLTHVFNFYLNRTSLSLIKLNSFFQKFNNTYYPVRFNESSSNKFIELNKINDFCFFFIRKNRIFNKGRYSRNRQTYRTGVYWCLWFNILSVYGLYFIFYRLTFNFGYLWFPFIIFIGSFIFSRILKYNYINLNYILNDLRKFYTWCSLLYNDIIGGLSKYTYQILKNLNLFFLTNSYFFFKNEYTQFNKIQILTTYYIDYINNQDLIKFEETWDELNNSSNIFFLKL